MEFHVRENSREGWQSVWRQLKGAMPFESIEKDISKITDADYDKYVKCVFHVSLNGESEVTNLRYYLPLYSFLKRKHMIPFLLLKGEKGDLERARQFLGILINYEGMLVAFGSIEGTQREMIFKAYIERDHSLRKIDKDCLFCALTTMSKERVENGEYVYNLTCPSGYNHIINRTHLIDVDILKQVICELPNKKPKSKEQIRLIIWNLHWIDASDIMPLLPLSSDETYSNDILESLVDIYKSPYQSTKKESSSQESQCSEILPSFDGNLFAELIFCFLFRNIYISNQLTTDSSAQPSIDDTLIQKTVLDSKSYAEALWQLIENAHIHSSGKVAYFSIRIYKADPESSMSELQKEANTRNGLWRKYWITKKSAVKLQNVTFNASTDNIFNKRLNNNRRMYADFLEIYVLDDAINDDGTPLGILEKIRSDQDALSKEANLSHISDVFELTERDYADKPLNYYIKHYGLRWLLMHMARSHAIMQIYTPHLAETYTYNGKQYIKIRDFGGFCYSNIFYSEYMCPGYGKMAEESVVLNTATNEIRTILALQDSGAAPNNNWAEENGKVELLVPKPEYYSTEYSILIPLSYIPGANTHHDKPSASKQLIFGGDKDFFRNAKVRNVQLNFEKLEQYADNIKRVYELSNQLKSALNSEGDKLFLNYFSLSEYSAQFIELLAKALFSYIYATSGTERTPPLLLALDFDTNKDQIGEFVRIFSIFYEKQGENKYMENVQIALCARSSDSLRKEVCFIIAGTTLRSAYDTANSFVYHNVDASLSYVSLLDYLTPKTEGARSKQIAICPFDLILTADSHNMCWFLEQMKNKLDTDQRTNKYGCKLSDVHVRLGSKIHINNFYEAELLFHNVGNINRFAYLVASDITKDMSPDTSLIFLVGYENYSSVLLQEIARLLLVYNSKLKISWVIDRRSSGKFPYVSFDKFSKEEMESWKNKKALCYTLIPIGSTMSTVHKLISSFERGLESELGNDKPSIIQTKNYAVIAVGNCFVPGWKANGEESSYYIKSITPAQGNSCWNTCTLQPHVNSTPPIEVNYCLWAESQWHLANPLEGQECNAVECALTEPLIQVDKTSTLLNAIFQTPLPQEVLKYYNRSSKLSNNLKQPSASQYYWESRSSKELLSPKNTISYIRYGHIAQGNNHYQFYFDFEKITQSDIIREYLLQWASELEVEHDAYNIVISPLLASNAGFLKIILDSVFSSNLHLLHIDINGIGKESVRTKFEYISEELKQIGNAYSTLNFYYVDDSICTGMTIQRAYKLLCMLCEQAEIDMTKLVRGKNGFKFKKVFLLVNRNSYETAKAWVENPANDWWGFINLCIPPYNTYANTCPACKVRDRFELLSKKCATNKMTRYFARNALKHKARTPLEHDRYIDSEIMDNPAYLSWLRTFMLSHKKEYFTNIVGDKYEYIKARIKDDSLACSKKTLRSLFPPEEVTAPFLIMRHVISQEHFWRLCSMDYAYRKLVYSKVLQNKYSECVAGKNVDPKNLDFREYQEALFMAMLNLLYGAFSRGKSAYDRVALFCSYIKVISRDYIVRNYFIRKAVYEMLHCILLLLLEPGLEFKDEFEFKNHFNTPSSDNAEDTFRSILCNEAYVSLFFYICTKLTSLHSQQSLNVAFYYRILKIVIHRLALLHSSFIIREDVAERIVNAYCQLYNGDSEAQCFLPSLDELAMTYIASVKTATMAEDDDGMCQSLLKLGKQGGNSER